MSRIHPTVSILMPAFNAESYLALALESVMRQTYRNFEFIIIDDGSTDGSRALLARYARTDSRVRLISRPNTGLVIALTEMADLARGEFLARMDADDICMPNRLRSQVDYFESNTRAVCIGGAAELIDGEGNTLHRPAPVCGNDNVQAEALRGRTPILHPSSMFRTSAFHEVGGYRENAWPAEDLELFLRLGEIGELDNVPDTVLKYRVHTASISVTRREQQLAKMREACEGAWKRRGIKGEFEGCPDPSAAELEHLREAGVVHTVATNPTAQAMTLAGTRGTSS